MPAAFIMILKVCPKHEKLEFERTLFQDGGDKERTLIASYIIK